MLIDHVGASIFPASVYPFGIYLRLIGRLAMPIFAWCIAQGAIHTRSRVKYLLRMAVMALSVQAVYYMFEKSFHLYIPVVWFLSLVIIFTLRDFIFALGLLNKKQSGQNSPALPAKGGEAKNYSLIALRAVLFIMAFAGTYLFCRYFEVDYGFAGVLFPVFGALTNRPTDNKLMFAFGFAALTLIAYSSPSGIPLQYFSIAAVIPVLLYNGRRGSARLKWFFWVFYPAHLAVILLIARLLGRV